MSTIPLAKVQFCFFDPDLQLRYYYDEPGDQMVYENGSVALRPPGGASREDWIAAQIQALARSTEALPVSLDALMNAFDLWWIRNSSNVGLGHGQVAEAGRAFHDKLHELYGRGAAEQAVALPPLKEDSGYSPEIETLVASSVLQPEVADAPELQTSLQQSYDEPFRDTEGEFLAVNHDNTQTQDLPLKALEEHTKRPAREFARLLRSLRKETDTVLLKRTQFLHERQKLERCRKQLRKSTDNLMNTMKIDRSAPLTDSQKKKRRRRVKKEGGNENIAKSTSSHESDTSSSDIFHPDVVSGVKDSVLDQAQPPEPGVAGAPKSLIAGLFEQYSKDYEALREPEKAVKELMRALSILEYELAEKEKTVYARMHSSTIAADLRTEMLSVYHLSSDSGSQPESVSDTATLVVQYFDKQGDVGVFEERLNELEFTYRDSLAQRDFLRERGDIPGMSDEEFEESFQDRRQKIQQDLELAMEEAAILAEQCENAGHDINAHRTARRSALASQKTSSPRISTWLQNVADGVPNVSYPAEFSEIPLSSSENELVRSPPNSVKDVAETERSAVVEDSRSPTRHSRRSISRTGKPWLPIPSTADPQGMPSQSTDRSLKNGPGVHLDDLYQSQMIASPFESAEDTTMLDASDAVSGDTPVPRFNPASF